MLVSDDQVIRVGQAAAFRSTTGGGQGPARLRTRPTLMTWSLTTMIFIVSQKIQGRSFQVSTHPESPNPTLPMSQVPNDVSLYHAMKMKEVP